MAVKPEVSRLFRASIARIIAEGREPNPREDRTMRIALVYCDRSKWLEATRALEDMFSDAARRYDLLPQPRVPADLLSAAQWCDKLTEHGL